MSNQTPILIPPNRFVDALAERTGRLVMIDAEMEQAVEAQRLPKQRKRRKTFNLTDEGRKALDVRLMASWLEARRVVLEAHGQVQETQHADMPVACVAILTKLAGVFEEARKQIGSAQ